jgi:hypothetical protein
MNIEKMAEKYTSSVSNATRIGEGSSFEAESKAKARSPNYQYMALWEIGGGHASPKTRST